MLAVLGIGIENESSIDECMKILKVKDVRFVKSIDTKNSDVRKYKKASQRRNMNVVKNKLRMKEKNIGRFTYPYESNREVTLDIKFADKTSDDEDGMKCNYEMKITRVCEVNADMCGNIDDVDSVRSTISKTKDDGMTKYGLDHAQSVKGTEVSCNYEQSAAWMPEVRKMV
ncbi:33394_t:CDS:2 [Gigaspora margarita]|uniref:33394_t:CDS:1 n=1 Tax=Gigaspora margarita TaxID=4874 RepID=A0ABN7UU95_GIGMA|nr:33394_t:CDS:2 [Gigaspora margarita]